MRLALPFFLLAACSSASPERQIAAHLADNGCSQDQPCTVFYQEANAKLVVMTSVDRYEVLPSTQDLGTSLVDLGCVERRCDIWSAVSTELTLTIEFKNADNQGAMVVTDQVASTTPSS